MSILSLLTNLGSPQSDTALTERQRVDATASQKSDTSFAEFMEVRGAMRHAPMPNAAAKDAAFGKEAASQDGQRLKTNGQHVAGGHPSMQGIPLAAGAQAEKTPTDRLQHRALSMLNGLTGGGIELSGLAGATQKSLDTAQGIALRQARSHLQTHGIALPDRSMGIPLDSVRRSGRSTPAQATAATTHVTPRSTSRARREDIGALSAKFESGAEGIAAIGYDRSGGTSYGKYQIASRPGTMSMFIDFLQKEDPVIAERLATAGPTNTGSRNGEMPRVWREIAAEAPEHFEDLQEQFIAASHYRPALQAVRQAGYNTASFSPAMKEVLFSTSVQHGPTGAANIFEQAAANVGLNPADQRRQENDLIREVYAIRSGKFTSSSPQVQASVRRRLENEGALALNIAKSAA